MSTYDPGGRAHRVLAYLEQGPALMSELSRVSNGSGTASSRRKQWYILAALIDDHLIHSIADGYEITEAGHRALFALRSGEQVVIASEPNVRIFQTEERAP
jgi:hypothetical protein